jgi:2-dehydropantoate 2-reductase
MQRTTPDQLTILILGAGAIGGYLGASLALHGHRIVTLEREHNAEILRKQGFFLTIGERTHHLENIAVVTSIEEALKFVSFDAVFIAVKSYDTEAVITILAPYSAQLPAIVCFQNGVENEAAFSAALGAGKVIAGTVTTAVAKEGPGRIKLERLRGIGLSANHAISKRLAAAMNAARLNARLYENADSMKWSKLLTNLLCNATCAILDLTPAQVIANPELFDLEIRQLQEALSVMRALNLKVVDLPGTPVRALAFGIQLPTALDQPLMARKVGSGRGGKMPSLHIDLFNRRDRSEVDWLNGAVVRTGERMAVKTPVNKLLNETLTKLVENEITLETYKQNPEKLLAELRLKNSG